MHRCYCLMVNKMFDKISEINHTQTKLTIKIGNRKLINWNKKDFFEKLNKIFIDDLNLLFKEWHQKKRKKETSVKIVYLTILIILLNNGLRLTETLESFKKWIQKGDKELIPKILQINRDTIIEAINLGFGSIENIKSDLVRIWCLENYGIDLNTLRKVYLMTKG